MRWSDLDLDKGVWTLTGEQTKAKRAHLIPLSYATVQVLRKQCPGSPTVTLYSRPLLGPGTLAR